MIAAAIEANPPMLADGTGAARPGRPRVASERGQVITCPDGRPLDARQDWEEFKELLAEAGINDRTTR